MILTKKNKYMTRAKTNLQFGSICIFRLDLVRLQLLHVLDIILIKRTSLTFVILDTKQDVYFVAIVLQECDNLSKNDSSTRPFCTCPALVTSPCIFLKALLSIEAGGCCVVGPIR